MRLKFAVLAFLAGTICLGQVTQAETQKVVRLIVPFNAGGTTDRIARLVAPGLGREIGEQVVVINKVGASGTIGTAEVAHATPDGGCRLAQRDRGRQTTCSQ